MTTADVLATVFVAEPCDFCPCRGPVYIDPETRCRYCLACLTQATDPANALPELPADPALTEMGRTIIADLRKKKNHARN